MRGRGLIGLEQKVPGMGLWPLLVALVAAGPALLACAGPQRSHEPLSSASERGEPERRIESMVHEWFALLANETPEPRTLERFLAKPTFELSLVEGSVRNLSEFRAWLSSLRSACPRLEYRIDPIHVDRAGEGLYRVQFEFERRAVDPAGTPHIARREQTWLVRQGPREAPVIVRIDERPLLWFPGTGPQIICS